MLMLNEAAGTELEGELDNGREVKSGLTVRRELNFKLQ